MPTGLTINSGQFIYFDEFRNMTRLDRTVNDDGDCEVTAAGGMDVAIAAGTVNFGNGANLVAVVVGGTTKTIAASDPSLDRMDLVVVNNAGTVSVLTGTAAAVPHPPAYDPDTYVVLARVFVDDGVTSIGSGDIKDLRVVFNQSAAAGTGEVVVDTFLGDTTNPPDQGLVGYTPTLDFDPSTSQIVYNRFKVPVDADDTADITLTIPYTMSSSFAGDVKLNLDVYVVTSGGDLTPASPTESTTHTFTAVATADQMAVLASTSLKISGSNFASGDWIHFKLYRDAAAGGDTHTGDFRLIEVRFQYTQV